MTADHGKGLRLPAPGYAGMKAVLTSPPAATVTANIATSQRPKG